jgi:predicted metal-dependent phosphoesterase TrpH
VVRAGRKFRKTSMMVSWLFENAMMTGLTCPYIAPNRVQAKTIAWKDHVARMLQELGRKKVPHIVNESELSVTFPNGGRVMLMGVENKNALRGISNWHSCGLDEYDDWGEDIWPTIIRPNLMVHRGPAMVAGTPRGFKNIYRLAQNPDFKEFHFTSYDNPDLDPKELEDMVSEYKKYGEDYFQQEIMAEYIKPVGTVYKEWNLEHYKEIEYNPDLPLFVSFDWGVNDPTAILWIQTHGAETRVIDCYEASDASIEHFISVLNSKPYKKPDMYCGDPAGKARTLTTGTSVIEILADKGIYVKITDGVTIPEQVRLAHTKIPGLWISVAAARFREAILNYRYPVKGENLVNQSNEIPLHDKESHLTRAFEYWCVNYFGGSSRVKRLQVHSYAKS